MRERRGELLGLALLGVLILLASALAARNQAAQEEQRYGSTRSSGAVGARALYLWLEGLGYPVERLQRATFTLNPADEVLWILTPDIFPGISEREAREIEEWVRGGGTLVWVDSYPTATLFDALEVKADTFQAEETTFRPVAPWLQHPDVQYAADFTFTVPPGATPLLATETGDVGAMHLPLGDGEAWLFSSVEPFTNEGLREAANSALVEGVLAQLPPGATMTFDEIHHGFGGMGETRSLATEMRRAPWGWAIYYAAAIFALWLLLYGRAFGRPLPLPGEHLRRESSEYARSMAWLYRRARLRQPVLRFHRERLVRRLTERYRLPLFDNDDAFVGALARVRPGVDEAALRGHLHALRQPNLSESQLVSLARANDEWLDSLLSR